MIMAADQRKRRLSSNNVDGCKSHELRGIKKKSLASLQFGSLMKPHISLELDGSQMQVVAKREQIGLSRRDLAPFTDCVSHHHKTLADVITLPKEIFSLESLQTVFSYEVWREYLNEDERLILLQFLPKGVDVEEVVQSLFEGINFSFGNPLLKWCNMLASGDLHPDSIIQRNCSLFANQKAYCSKLQEYHIGMLRNLLKLKETWDGCQDPVEFVPNISRTHNHTVNSTDASPYEYKLQNSNHSFGESSESLSTMEHDQACSSSSDEHAVIVGKIRQPRKRKGLMLDNTRIPQLTSGVDLLMDVQRHRKDESRNCNVLDNGAKYMNCVRITKKQLKLLKSMKQPGKCIQSKSVNHVLGNLSSYKIQPFATFEEEERRKLHMQWLLVVNTVAQASAEWRVRRGQKEQIAQLLYQDIKENAKQVLQDEESTGYKQTDFECSGPADPELNMVDCDSTVSALAGVQDTLQQSTVVGDGLGSNDVDSVENDGSETADLIQSSRENGMLDMASENDIHSNGIDSTYVHVPPDFRCTSNASFGGTRSRDAPSATPGVWQPVKPSLPSRQSTLAGGYTNVISKMPCQDLQSNLDHHPQFLNSETELLESGTESGMPYSLNNQQTFSTFQNEDRSGLLLQSIFSSPGLSSYKPHQKQVTPHFPQAHNVLIGNPRIPIQYQESLHQTHPMEARLKIDEQRYLNQHSSNNMHDPHLSKSNNGSSFPVLEQLPPFPLQDWHANSIGVATMPLQPPSHAGHFSTQNWYSPGQQIHGGWSNTPNDVPILLSQSIRNESGNNDESLFSVLSQCKELRSSTYDHHMDSMGHDMPLGAYEVTGGNTPRIINVVPQTIHPLEFFNGTEVAPALPANSIEWENIPHQTSNLPDPLEKPFLRSWNQ